VIERALYGLRTSGARWHDRFADTLRDMGFASCRADPDVWLKYCDTHYEYVCVYVDDLMAIAKIPMEFLKTLTEKHQYKLKGVGPPTYHL
jgi:Reverse transcriptase (RNA-dependent DNA polymerase)